MKSFGSAVVALALTLGPVWAGTGNVDKREYVCMMQDMVLEKPGIPIQFDGKTYYGCCDMCKEKIRTAPDVYTRALDRVAGKKIDKATAYIYNLNGDAFYFSSDANRKAFAADPAKYLKK